MKPTMRLAWLPPLLAVLASSPAAARVGISSQFLDVVLENLKPGRSYNIRELKGVPYTVKNRSDATMDILVEIAIPTTDQVKAPYEPIPDPSWVRVLPERYRLGPDSLGFSDLIITLPEDPALVGRHFHAFIWARTANPGTLAAGVKSAVRFSVGRGPDSLEDERRRKAMADINYDMWPTALYVRNAAPGPYDVKMKEKRSFKLTNRSDKPLELALKAIPWQSAAVGPAQPGYTIVEDLRWVQLVPERIVIEPDSVEEVRLVMDVPEAYKGKKLVFLVQLSLPIGVIIGAANQVYVEVP